MDASPRLALPWIEPGQAEKELTHNEALVQLDLLVQASVAGIGANSPPPAPQPGRCDIVGGAPTGAWAGHPGAIAGWTAAGWRFVAPREGMAVWNESEGVTARFAGGAWRSGRITATALEIDGKQVIGAQRPAIANPAGGPTNDTEARTTIGAILSALRYHGLIAP